MSKPVCTFGFDDEPQYRTVEDRSYIAHMLRSFHNQPGRYDLRRSAPGKYSVRVKHRGSAPATITTR